MPHQSPIRQGHKEIVEAYNSDFKKGVASLTLSPYAVIEAGELVAERGDATVSIKVNKAKMIDRVVKYVVIWKILLKVTEYNETYLTQINHNSINNR